MAGYYSLGTAMPPSTSFSIPDIDIVPFPSLSKYGITKTVSYNHFLGSDKPALIDIFVVSLLEV